MNWFRHVKNVKYRYDFVGILTVKLIIVYYYIRILNHFERTMLYE